MMATLGSLPTEIMRSPDGSSGLAEVANIRATVAYCFGLLVRIEMEALELNARLRLFERPHRR
jgi:hypothetical protein